MTRGEQVIAKAKTFLGYKESPKNSNKTIFNQAYYGSDTSARWCCTFVWYIFHSLGFDAYFKDGQRDASCTSLMKHELSKGRGTNSPLPGDKVFFNFDNDPASEHIGLFVRWIDKDRFESIEGNTGLNNNSNGGEVMLRVRRRSQVITFTSSFPDEIKPTVSVRKTVAALSGLWLRVAPYGDKIFCMPKGAPVSVLTGPDSGGWVKVNYLGTVGWCSAKYLK